ncbi:MAG: NusG domain II-containing protein [Pseudomonadota bacterium]
MFKHLRPGDLLLIFALGLLATVLAIFLPPTIISTGDTVFIESRNQLVGRYSLHQERDVTVVGPLGETKVRIKRGRVSIISSPCPNHYCVNMGESNASGSALVCVPNEIIVRVGGDETKELDAISR